MRAEPQAVMKGLAGWGESGIQPHFDEAIRVWMLGESRSMQLSCIVTLKI